MRKALVLTGLTCSLVGFVLGAMFWYLAGPLFVDEVVSETITAAETRSLLARGTFQDVDAIHKGSGTATLYGGDSGQRTLRFADFRVTNGPALEVWLVGNDSIASSDDVTSSPHVSLGRLKGNVGDQNYRLPADLDLAAYESVVIWCEAFGVLFSHAPLSPQGL